MKPSLKNWLSKNKHTGFKKACTTALSLAGKSCCALYLLLCINSAYAQNLVPNPSFELYDTCPVSSLDGQLVHALPWTGPGGSSDYYNSCAPNAWPFHNVPFSSFGFQYAHTGSAYAGLSLLPNNGASDSREYLQAPLLDSLQAGKCYLVSFFVNFCNASACSVNNMAATFTDSAFTNPGSLVVNLPSRIYKFGNPVLKDTLSWTEIKGLYTANGGEKYITIGNFHTDAETETSFWNTSALFAAAYYYVDDVSVLPADDVPGGLPVFAGNDVTILSGDSTFIGQELTGLNCTWYEGGTVIAGNTSGLFVHPAVTTTYIVQQDLCGTVTYDTVEVHVSATGIDEPFAGNDIQLYPNPNAGEFSIRSSANDLRIEIRDLSGRMVYTENISEPNNARIRLDLSNGVYFAYISTDGRQPVIRRLVIQK